jgi:hypothetical protein
MALALQAPLQQAHYLFHPLQILKRWLVLRKLSLF